MTQAAVNKYTKQHMCVYIYIYMSQYRPSMDQDIVPPPSDTNDLLGT